MTDHYPPGPKVGFAEAILSGQGPLGDDRLNFMRRMADTYGPSVCYQFGRARIFMFFEPDLVHEVLVDHPDKFHKSRMTRRLLERVMGHGLLLSEGDDWKRQRRLVQPAFHARRIEGYAQVMTRYAADLAEEWARGPLERDIAQEMMRLTLRIVARTLFDADVSGSAQRAGEAMNRLQAMVNRVTATVVRLPQWVPTPLNVEGGRAQRILDAIIADIIGQRRASGEDRGDLLSMLLLARDEEDGSDGLSDRELHDEVMTLFLAGHETTSLALTWTWYLLSQNPEVEARLHAELDDVLGGRLPELADLPALAYTDQVVKESMRLYPPVYVMARTPPADVRIGGYDIPRGSGVLLSPFVTQRDPRWWPDPDAFRPERFEPGWEETLPRYAYFPFGGGPRVCIGNAFALMEVRLLLATLAQRFRLTLAPGQRIEPEPMVTLRPKHGLRMAIGAREGLRVPARLAEPA